MQKSTQKASIVSWGISNRLVKDKMSSPASPMMLTIREWSDVLTHKEHLQRHMSSNRWDIWVRDKLMIGLAINYKVYPEYRMICVLVSNSSTLLGCEAAISSYPLNRHGSRSKHLPRMYCIVVSRGLSNSTMRYEGRTNPKDLLYRNTVLLDISLYMCNFISTLDHHRNQTI